MSRIIIVGGGIIGVASAYFLAHSGFQVVVLEHGSTLGGLSTAASLQAVRGQFNDPVNIACMVESIEFYEQFAERLDLPGHDIGFRQQGYLFVTSESSEAPQMAQRVAFQHTQGLNDVEYLEQDELQRRFPYLAPTALAATFRQRDGWLSAHEALMGFRQAARRLGAEFRLQTPVVGFMRNGDPITGVITPNGNLEGEAVVIATGPFSGLSAQAAGIDLPVSPVRRHRLVIGEHALIPGWAPMTIDHDTGAHWRPEGPGAALAWAEPESPSPPSFDVRPDPGFPFRVLEGVCRLNPFWEDVVGSLPRSQVFLHAGQYAETPDHNPLVGPAPGLPGLWINSGYGGHGVMMTPAGARLLADLMSGKRSPSNNPFALDRPSLATGGQEHMVI